MLASATFGQGNKAIPREVLDEAHILFEFPLSIVRWMVASAMLQIRVALCMLRLEGAGAWSFQRESR